MTTHTLTPRVAAAHDRRRARFKTRLAEAPNPSRQVAAASDYLRGLLDDLPPDVASAAAQDAVAALNGIADRLTTVKGGRSR